MTHEHTALSAAVSNVKRKLSHLNDSSMVRNLPNMHFNPEGCVDLANLLDTRIGALVTGVNLLRHEARLAIEAQKAVR